MNKIKNFFTTQPANKIISILAVLLIVLLILQAGMVIGFRKAAFACNWDRSLSLSPRDPRSFMAPFMMGNRDNFNPHGVVGEIISTNFPTIMVKEPDAAEKIVMIGNGTTIRYMHATASTSDLETGSRVIIIGNPDDNGRIKASLIRLLPPLPPIK
ncbi:MAG: hypothetical protein WCT02_01600 [Candidatus Paceibacterota bacterium]|jgi:hypothetical protein